MYREVWANACTATTLGLFFCARAWAAPAAPLPALVDYNQDIRPILSDNCFACHGQDSAHREARLRLDRAADAMAPREGLPAITPGQLEKSELWWRITTADPDERMPPSDSPKPPLQPGQRELIKRWIEQGATYQNHWAYEPVRSPAVPVTDNQHSEIGHQSSRANSSLLTAPLLADYSRPHPIDAFVRARLAREQLTLTPEASPEILIRRVTLDLTGLPPTPEEVDEFIAAYRSPSLPPSVSPSATEAAYAALVDRLLASPRYGEHFARYWLDAVRYGDTHGLHLDNVREIWPYRDWVVNAFNRNQPFDQFTIEQLAGDLLPNPRQDQLVASGYNRNILSTSEGGALEAEAEVRNTADRVDTTAAVWLGLTANCASCHDHKFDPLTQREYYALGAIFKGLADRVWDGNFRQPGPRVLLGTPEQEQRLAAIAGALPPLQAALSARAEQLPAEMNPPPDIPAAAAPSPDPPGGPPEKKSVSYEVIWAEDGDVPAPDNVGAPAAPGEWREGPAVPLAGGRRALRLEGKVGRPFQFAAGDVPLVVRTELKVFVHFQPDATNPPRAISLELVGEEKTQRLVWGDAAAFGADGAKDATVVGPLPAAGAYTRLELDALAAGLKSGQRYHALHIAQSDGAGWWDSAGAECASPTAAADPLLTRAAWISAYRNNDAAMQAASLPFDIKFLLALPPQQQNAGEKERVANFYRDYIYGPSRRVLEPEAHAVRRLLAEHVRLELTLPSSPISQELPEPVPAHVLIRGQYDKPGERVAPGTPAFLPPIVSRGVRVTRLDFARWLVDGKNPLTARVTVNRFWQQFFGAGLVRTPADFGAQGEPPTHPALLDWLAGEFVRSGWDVKQLARLIVTSRAYRQDSRVGPELLETDPANRLFARGPRLRLDAEVLRDQALALGGLLQPALGGPPVRPYQPVNVWEPVAFGGSNTKTYVPDQGAALYRRSLYTFWKRTAPAPAMATFDAPSRETFCVGRGRSNTPLQALALMNDVQQFEAARGLAERMLLRAGSEAGRLAYAFRRVTARMPTGEESALLADALATHRAHYARHPAAAQQVLANGHSQANASLPVIEFAAWTMVANLLLNLDETLNRN